MPPPPPKTGRGRQGGGGLAARSFVVIISCIGLFPVHACIGFHRGLDWVVVVVGIGESRPGHGSVALGCVLIVMAETVAESDGGSGTPPTISSTLVGVPLVFSLDEFIRSDNHKRGAVEGDRLL